MNEFTWKWIPWDMELQLHEKLLCFRKGNTIKLHRLRFVMNVGNMRLPDDTNDKKITRTNPVILIGNLFLHILIFIFLMIIAGEIKKPPG